MENKLHYKYFGWPANLLPLRAVAKVYPVGIPALYAAILWKHRELLNPRKNAIVGVSPGAAEEAAAPKAGPAEGVRIGSPTFRPASLDQTGDALSPYEFQTFQERVRARKTHPQLAPSAFLWRDFGEGGVCEKKHMGYMDVATKQIGTCAAGYIGN